MTGLDEYNNNNLNRILNYIEEHPKVKGFYGYLRTDKSLTSIYQYVKMAQHLLDYSGKEPAGLSFDDYTSYLAYISTNKDGSPKTTSYSIQQYHALKNYSTYLVESGVASKDYMLNVRRPKAKDSQRTIERRKKGFLTKEEIKQYLDAVKSGVGTDHAKVCQYRMRERDLAMIMIFLTTGIRVSAMWKLDVSSVDLESGTLWVTDKGSKVNQYRLNNSTVQAIRDWLHYRKYALKGNQTDALFVNQYGDRISKNGIAQIVTKYAADINGKHITPHKLRATYGTQLYEATKDVYFVQKAMGHSSPTTTERYIRGQEEVTKEASDIMGNLF